MSKEERTTQIEMEGRMRYNPSDHEHYQFDQYIAFINGAAWADNNPVNPIRKYALISYEIGETGQYNPMELDPFNVETFATREDAENALDNKVREYVKEAYHIDMDENESVKNGIEKNELIAGLDYRKGYFFDGLEDCGFVHYRVVKVDNVN